MELDLPLREDENAGLFLPFNSYVFLFFSLVLKCVSIPCDALFLFNLQLKIFHVVNDGP
jgi:hypothetical protein